MEEFYIQCEKEYRALANRRRLRIISFLKRTNNVCVLDIAEMLEVSMQTASKHLRLLFLAGILTRDQVGGEMHYRLTKTLSNHLQDPLTYL